MAFHMRIIIIVTVISSSATEEVKKLTGTEGESITLPDPVVEEGVLLFGRKTVALVIERKLKIYEGPFKDKVLWNNNTGLFTITALQRTDSGIYVIDSKTGRVSITTYHLTVYEPVPPPAVYTVSVSTESCTLLCLVTSTEETTLLWYKDGEIVNQSSSALSLPLTVLKQDLNSSYRCVSTNPAEEKTAPVNVSTACRGQTDSTSSSNRQCWWWVRILVVVFVGPVVVYIIFTNVKKERKRERETAAPSTLH